MEMNVQAAERAAAAAAAAGLPLMQGNGVYMPEWGHGQTPEWAQTALQQVRPEALWPPAGTHLPQPRAGCWPRRIRFLSVCSLEGRQEVPRHALLHPASHRLLTVHCPLHGHVPAGGWLSSALSS